MFLSKWIAPSQLQNDMHIRFKKQFSVNGFCNALIRITADDFYKLYINGRYVGEGPAPSYPFRYRYNEFDISEHLQNGINTVEAAVYYQGLTNRVWVSGDDRAGMIADVIVDGKYLTGTDGSWKYSIDHTFTGGDTLGYDTSFCENRDFTARPDEERSAVEADCDYTFDSAPFPAVELENISVEPIKNGNRYFYDFNREYVGTPIIKAVSKTDGSELVIRCAEEPDENGNPRFDMRCGCRYEEKCTLKSGENLIEQYGYRALRYMEIITDESVEVLGAELAVRHYPFPENAQAINTDDQSLKAVFQLCRDTVHYGVQEALIDCPTREKGQYLGDAYVTGFAHYYLTRDSRLLKKALYDFADSVKYSGRFLSVAPCSYQQKIADYDLLYPHFLLKYYQLTNDRHTLEELAFVCDYILSEYAQYKNADGLLENVTGAWNLVDWPENMRDGYEYSPDGENEYGLHSVINAYYVFATDCTQKINAILEKENTLKTDGLIKAYNKTFFDSKAGLYRDCKGGNHCSLHSNMLPLAFGLLPENGESVASFVLEKGMRCSVYMSYFYLKALCVAGHKEKALEAITSNSENSWMNMINEGATATFEAWGKDRKWNTSLFHPWAVAPILILNEHFENLLS